MAKDRIRQLARQIVFGPDESPDTDDGKSVAAFTDPTVWIGFIQAIMNAIQQCRENRAKRIARRLAKEDDMRPRRRASLHAWLSERIEPYLRQDQDGTIIRQQAIELAERTLDKAESMDKEDLVEVIEELQNTAELSVV